MSAELRRESLLHMETKPPQQITRVFFSTEYHVFTSFCVYINHLKGFCKNSERKMNYISTEYNNASHVLFNPLGFSN